MHGARDRESSTTMAAITVARATRFVAATLLLLSTVACGQPQKREDTYARATDVQGACCENLGGSDRDQCLRDIVRVDDPAASQTGTSQATSSCVAQHFVCDPQRGKATPASAQAQYDCLEELE